METEIKYMKLRTKNAAMMRMYGDELTWSEAAREMRTNGLHAEIQHTDRYGGISQSCTMSDGCDGHRFKMNNYSHGYRWSTVYIPVTAEQEARLFAKGCEMADLDDMMRRQMLEIVTGCRGSINPFEAAVSDCQHLYDHPESGCYYGLNHIEYDKGAAFFSFISKRNIWKPSKTKLICNRACGEVLLEVWPDIFSIPCREEEATHHGMYFDDIDSDNFNYKEVPCKVIPAHRQTPDDTHYLTAHFFDNKER